MIIELLIVVRIWRRITSLKNNTQKSESYAWFWILLVLLIILFVLYVIGETLNNLKILIQISYFIFLVIVIGLTISGVIFAYSIHQTLGHSIKMSEHNRDAKQKLLESILHTIIAFIILAVIVCLISVIHALNVTINPYAVLWAWYFPLHLCENVLVFMFGYTVSVNVRGPVGKINKNDGVNDTNNRGSGEQTIEAQIEQTIEAQIER